MNFEISFQNLGILQLFGGKKLLFGETRQLTAASSLLFGVTSLLFGRKKLQDGVAKQLFGETSLLFGENKQLFIATRWSLKIALSYLKTTKMRLLQEFINLQSQGVPIKSI